MSDAEGSARTRSEGRRRTRSKAAILARRRRVARYLLRGLAGDEIAVLEKVGIATVNRDIEAVHKEWQEKVDLGKDVNEALKHMIAQSHERRRMAWQIMHEQQVSSAVKVGAIRSMREEDAHLLAVLQSLGALPKEPDRYEDTTDWRKALRALRAAEHEQPVSVTNRLSRN